MQQCFLITVIYVTTTIGRKTCSECHFTAKDPHEYNTHRRLCVASSSTTTGDIAQECHICGAIVNNWLTHIVKPHHQAANARRQAVTKRIRPDTPFCLICNKSYSHWFDHYQSWQHMEADALGTQPNDSLLLQDAKATISHITPSHDNNVERIEVADQQENGLIELEREHNYMPQSRTEWLQNNRGKMEETIRKVAVKGTDEENPASVPLMFIASWRRAHLGNIP